MTTDISVNKYIDDNLTEKKAVVGAECSFDNPDRYDLQCKITLGNFDTSIDSYIDSHYGTDLAVSSAKCSPEDKTAQHIECDISLGPLYTTKKVYVDSATGFNLIPLGFDAIAKSGWYDQKVQNNDISIDKYIDTFTSKSIAAVACSGSNEQLKCSVDLGEFDVNVDKYIDTLTDKAVTDIQCSPDEIDDTAEELQELICSIQLSDWN